MARAFPLVVLVESVPKQEPEPEPEPTAETATIARMCAVRFTKKA